MKISLTFRAITANDAQTILNWCYTPPYNFYNHEPNCFETDLQYLLTPANRFYALFNQQGLVGYCSFGADAQVLGGNYKAEALDIGVGIHPDLTGQGHGILYISAVVELAQRTFSPKLLRFTVAQFNQRAQRVWEKAGFQQVEEFCKHQSRTIFVIMTRAISKPIAAMDICLKWK